MPNYIVNFLLVLPAWFIIGPCLVQIDKLGKNINLKTGFTWHYWTLSNELYFEIFTLLKEKADDK